MDFILVFGTSLHHRQKETRNEMVKGSVCKQISKLQISMFLT